MVKLVSCVRRRADLPPEEFFRYWRDDHGLLVANQAAALGITRSGQALTPRLERAEVQLVPEVVGR